MQTHNVIHLPVSLVLSSLLLVEVATSQCHSLASSQCHCTILFGAASKSGRAALQPGRQDHYRVPRALDSVSDSATSLSAAAAAALLAATVSAVDLSL